MEKPPPTELTTAPAPSQVGHTCGRVPGLPPVPEQVGHGASELSLRLMVLPSMASWKSRVVSVSTSAPLLGRGVLVRVPKPPPPPPPRLNRSPKRSEMSKLPGPPVGWPPPNPPGKPPPPAKTERISSYSLRFAGSP